MIEMTKKEYENCYKGYEEYPTMYPDERQLQILSKDLDKNLPFLIFLLENGKPARGKDKKNREALKQFLEKTIVFKSSDEPKENMDDLFQKYGF